jgi:Sap, sulfolipid-1-addressing protein
MLTVIASLLPLIVGASIGCPAWLIVVLIFLRGKDGVAKATAFAAGVIAVRTLQFALFGRLFGTIASANGQDVFDLIPSTLLLVAGLVLVVTAIRTWWCKEEDLDAPPPRWMTLLGAMSTPAAFGMAVVLMFVGLKQWVFTLSAIAVIDDAYLSKLATMLAYLFFILGAQALMLAPVISSAFAPAASAKVVEIVLRWLERKNRLITIGVSLAFGAWFLSKGVTSLVAHGGAAK